MTIKHIYEVEVSASNSVTFTAATLKDVAKRLARMQGTCSVANLQTNHEVFFGPVESVAREINYWIENISFNKSE